jgi:hypothetical protein
MRKSTSHEGSECAVREQGGRYRGAVTRPGMNRGIHTCSRGLEERADVSSRVLLPLMYTIGVISDRIRPQGSQVCSVMLDQRFKSRLLLTQSCASS